MTEARDLIAKKRRARTWVARSGARWSAVYRWVHRAGWTSSHSSLTSAA